METPELAAAGSPDEPVRETYVGAARPPGDPDQRLRWLFRDAARRGMANPLLALLRAYRAEGGRP